MNTHSVSASPSHPVDDWPTLAALGALAFAVTDVTHEALGHGLATLAVGGKAVLLTTCNFDSAGPYSRWIPAAGGLLNLAVGLASLVISGSITGRHPRCRVLLVLVSAFNLFFAFGYPAYSGIARFGDWAAVISGREPQWLWRSLLIVVAVTGYYGSMRLLARPLAPFLGDSPQTSRRLARLTRIPYIAAIILACLAASFNPGGWHTMLTAGLPAAAAAFGLTQMDHFVNTSRSERPEAIGPIQRSHLWIAAAIIVSIFFGAVLGPGIRFRQS